MNRADKMLAVLQDGRKHTRHDIFRAAGEFFLTNNAASELRGRGVDVRHGKQDGADVYWLEQLDDPADSPQGRVDPPLSPAGSSSCTEPSADIPSWDGGTVTGRRGPEPRDRNSGLSVQLDLLVGAVA